MRLSNQIVIARFHALIHEAAGEAHGFLHSVERTLDRSEAPGLTWTYESVSTGLVKGLFGKRRDYLLVRDKQFRDHVVCVAARPYGRHLDAVWYHTVSPRLGRRFQEVLEQGLAQSSEPIVGVYDLFDIQDLSAFVALTRHAVQAAVHAFRKNRGGVTAEDDDPDPDAAISI